MMAVGTLIEYMNFKFKFLCRLTFKTEWVLKNHLVTNLSSLYRRQGYTFEFLFLFFLRIKLKKMGTLAERNLNFNYTSLVSKAVSVSHLFIFKKW